jgi:hypothetical protein
VTSTPIDEPPGPGRLGPKQLLARPDFRRAYLAGAVSQLGDAFQFVALMWFAIATGGPLGVIAVRIGNSLPALLFGLHGGIAADRWDRRRTMIAADLVRFAVLVPMVVAGLAGALPLWGLVPAGFVLATATSYFVPASAAFLGVVFFGNVGAKPVGLALIAPLYLFLDPEVLFVAGGVGVFACSVAAAASVSASTRRALAAKPA